MARPSGLDVLLSLYDAPAGGDEVAQRLAAAGKATKAAPLLARLLTLESSGHVQVRRDGGYSFALTPLGADAVSGLAPGKAVAVGLLMVDLVGFVRFTVEHGDEAAQRAAERLHLLAASAVARRGGRVVKALGDGVLATGPVDADLVTAAVEIAEQLAPPEAGEWLVRAGHHVGSPIALRGDVFGHDVNLVARLRELAAPGEIVCSAPGVSDAELVTVRGLAERVPVIRRPLRTAP